MSTIFYPFTQERIDWPSDKMRSLFLNGQFHPDLSQCSGASVTIQQHFKPYEAGLSAAGFDVVPTLSEGLYDYALVLLPKSLVEARYLVAQALQSLSPSALIVCAAENKAGGTRIKKMLQHFGVENVQEASKNKARVCWGLRGAAMDEVAIAECLAAGQPQAVLGGAFISQPGIFGWDKADKGSQILLAHLPDVLKGRGADFGCGYGYLGRHVLERHDGVKALFSIDADYRAVEASRLNLEGIKTQAEKTHLWMDLAASAPAGKNLDFIVMNPPFHEGKKMDIDIGKAFIANAYASLRPRGRLHMVANAHLPYEAVLSEKFSEFTKVFEGQGFKIFSAVK